MIEDVRKLLDAYTAWLRDKTVLRQVGTEYIEVTTPYLDRHNDYVQIYVKRDDGGFLLTDDGYTIQDLRLSGCTLDTPKRQDLLKTTLNGFGVRLHGEAIESRATPQNFPLRKHNLVQAMLSVNDLFALAAPTVTSLFLEDVAQWLALSEVRYTPSVKFTGKSGYDHHFDFVVPASKREPERLLRAVSRPNREMAEALAFAWVDTREVRAPESKFYAILNDSDRNPQGSVVEALQNYSVTPVLWSQREIVRADLAA